MKIEKPTDMSSLTATSSAATQTAALQKSGKGASSVGKGAEAASESAGVAVTVSSKTRAMAAAEKSDAIDMKKVQAVRASIESGTFAVNPEAIADKLLSSSKEMMRRSSGA